jgi:beta-lactamase class A
MGRWQWCCRAATGTLTATVIAAGGLAAAPAASAATQICRSSTSANAALAAKMSQDIKNAYQGRSSVIGLHVDYPSLGLLCSYNSAKHFYAASTVKAIILAALLRKAEEQNRSLTSSEKSEATLMITQSDNTAATQLWNDVGMSRLQHFLNLAQMTHTVLGKNGYWGLTQETAYDESVLLHLLVTPNSVLTTSDRDYELNLMAKVISSQRWGTPAGVPTSYTVHVKNGWLPVSGYGWIINSLGAFTKSGPDYTMDVLTDGNKNSMQYGITTIEDIATKVNHDLNAGASSTVARSARAATWGVPDESIPASMTPGH